MKTATVRDLRNHYADLMEWLQAGEEIRITRKGKPIARLIPEPSDSAPQVQWTESPAVLRDRSGSEKLPAEDSAGILKDSAGKW